MARYSTPGGSSDSTPSFETLDVTGASTLGSGDDTTHVRSTLQVDGTTIQTGNLVMGSVLDHNGTQIGFFNRPTSAQVARITDATGGTVIDVEARAKIASILDLFDAYGLMSAT